jgi:hypothetical protein
LEDVLGCQERNTVEGEHAQEAPTGGGQNDLLEYNPPARRRRRSSFALLHDNHGMVFIGWLLIHRRKHIAHGWQARLQGNGSVSDTSAAFRQ